MERDGFLNVLKPPGMTSHDVVAWLRPRVGSKRVGHLGTLDPAAAGVLPVSLGKATRLFEYVGGGTKAYRAEIVFGLATDTLDAEGSVVSEGDSSGLTEEALRRALARHTGEVEQIPPAFSAAKIDGKPLHERARSGEMRQGRPKRVTISKLDLVAFEGGAAARALIDVECSTGTFIRVIAEQLGRYAGCGAYLGFLVRTRAGRFPLEEAHTLEAIEAASETSELSGLMLPLDWPLADLPQIDLDRTKAVSFVRGTGVAAGAETAWPVRAYGPGKLFLGLGEVVGEGAFRPKVVLASEGEIPA